MRKKNITSRKRNSFDTFIFSLVRGGPTTTAKKNLVFNRKFNCHRQPPCKQNQSVRFQPHFFILKKVSRDFASSWLCLSTLKIASRFKFSPPPKTAREQKAIPINFIVLLPRVFSELSRVVRSSGRCSCRMKV